MKDFIAIALFIGLMVLITYIFCKWDKVKDFLGNRLDIFEDLDFGSDD